MRIFQRINYYLAILATLAIVLTMFTTMASVGGRLVGVAIIGMLELNALLVGMCIYLGIAYTQYGKKHITVSLLTSKLPKRVSTILNIAVLTICIALFGWSIYLFYQAAYISFVVHEVSEGVSEFPLFYLKLVMFLGIVMLTLQLVLDITRELTELVTAQKRMKRDK